MVADDDTEDAADSEDEVDPISLAIGDLQQRIKSKKVALEGVALMRHRAVLGFLNSCKTRQKGEFREAIAFNVARTFRKGVYFARKIVTWERTWLSKREIPESRRGWFSN